VVIHGSPKLQGLRREPSRSTMPQVRLRPLIPSTPRRRGVVFALSPDRISLPRYDGRVGTHPFLFEVCTAFTCVAACTLAPVTCW
jgi:hypothetical protein